MTNFEIPCLTEEPSKFKKKQGIFISLFVLSLLSLNYSIFGILGEYKTYAFFFFSTIILFLYITYMVWLFSGNIIIIFRFLLLAAPIFITSYIWWKYEGNVHTHYLGHEYQTLKATYILVFAGSLSIIGAALGWFIGLIHFKQDNNNQNIHCFFSNIQIHTKKILLIGLSGALSFGLAYYFVSGGSLISKGGYATGIGQINIRFAVYNVFQMFFTSLTLIAVNIKKKNYKISFLILIFSFLLGVIAGSRADYLLPILFLLIIAMDRTILTKHYFNTRIIILKRYLKLFILAFIGFFSALAIGFWRFNIKMNLMKIFFDYFLDISSVLFVEIRGHTVFWMETANNMIGGFYGFIQKIDIGYTTYYYGLSYFNFIFRSLPGIIRPKKFDMLDLAWHTDVNGTIMSQGGIFEPAEAYANFGFIGCFVVSFLISFFFAYFMKKAKKNYSIF